MVLIDSSKTFQTIEGFGVTVPTNVDADAVYNPEFYEALTDDLGCSIVCSENGSNIAKALKELKPDLDNIAEGDDICVVSNIDENNTWGYLMALRVSNPDAKLKNISDYLYSHLDASGKYLVEKAPIGIIWKATFDDLHEITARNPAFYTRVPSGALDLALQINSALTQGNLSAYVCGPATTVKETEDPTKALCKLGEKGPKFQAAKHFFKYVTPGMTRIEAKADDLVVSAYKSDRTVVVLINDNDVLVDSHIEFTESVSQFTSYTSVENDYHYEESGSISGNKIDITMIPYSIITFVLN